MNFFQEYPDKHCFHIDKSKVSVLLPSAFMERKVRVYSKPEPEYVDAVDKAFVTHHRRMYGTEHQHTTARKRRRNASSIAHKAP